MHPKKLTTLLILLLVSMACSLPLVAAPATATASPSQTAMFTLSLTPSPTHTLIPTNTPVPSDTPTPTLTPTPTRTNTASNTPTITQTPTETTTPTLSPSPTVDLPSVTVNQQAHCRYGPARAYLHAGDLYAGDSGKVGGRFQLSGWLYVKFDNLKYYCWVAPSVVDVEGDINAVRYTTVNLPGPSILYGPPGDVTASRQGDEVTISWSRVDMTDDDDRGYFLDLMVCQDGHYLWWPVALESDNTTSYQVEDQKGCPSPSGGKLYVVEKHGYTDPVDIPWPEP